MPLQSTVLSWLKAARIPSQTYIFLPLLFGEAVALHQGHSFNVLTFLIVHLFGLSIQLYIVFANDYADQETDRHNVTFTPFSGGSRVLVDGDLRPVQVLRGASLMALASIAFGVMATLRSGSAIPTLLAGAGILLLWMYSYPPVRLSYRGGGELLQTIGVGIVLPLMGYSAFTGSITQFPWTDLMAVLPTQLACAIGTAVPDEPSDKEDSKRTLPVILGPLAARSAVVALHAISALLILSSYVENSLSFQGFMLLAPLVGQLCFLKSKPGSTGILAFTFLSILSTLTSMALLSLHYWS